MHARTTLELVGRHDDDDTVEGDLVRGQMIRRGIVQNGQVVITPDVASQSESLSVSLELDRFIAAKLNVQSALQQLVR